MDTTEIEVDASRERIVDLSRELERFCAGRGDGLVNAFVPHATAGLALMELGSGSEADLVAALDRLCRATTGTGMPMDRPVTEPITCFPSSSARRSPCHSSGVASRSAPGNPLCWSTSTSTTPGAGCASASCPPRHRSPEGPSSSRPAELDALYGQHLLHGVIELRLGNRPGGDGRNYRGDDLARGLDPIVWSEQDQVRSGLDGSHRCGYHAVPGILNGRRREGVGDDAGL